MVETPKGKKGYQGTESRREKKFGMQPVSGGRKKKRKRSNGPRKIKTATFKREEAKNSWSGKELYEE